MTSLRCVPSRLAVLLARFFVVVVAAPAAAAQLTPPAPGQPVTGVVVDGSGAAIVAAPVVAQAADGRTITIETDAEGRFAVPRSAPGPLHLTIVATGFEPVTITVTATEHEVRIVMQPSTVRESVTVDGVGGRAVTTTGMKTPTPLRDIPQAVSVVTSEQIRDLAMQGMSDVVRYVPGVGVAQGESNRDAPVLRGITTTGDFFVDGVRDDAQYFRDLYNVERVEVLKGPNAMAFGRGGVGGVINRVSKQAGWNRVRQLSLQGGSWANRRVTGDVGDARGRTAFRVTGVFEDSGSYRQGASLERQGLSPLIAVTLGAHMMVHASAEYFHDRRTADRGVPSLDGRPLPTDPSTFFGNANLSYAETTVNLGSFGFTRLFDNGIELRNKTQVASYDKFYQNVYPGAVNPVAGTVAVSAYNHGTDRTNAFNQTDLLLTIRTGRVTHRLATGVEVGRQSSGNLRKTGYFTATSPSATAVNVPLANPTTSADITFQPSATDADGTSVATVAAVYLQDQVRLFKPLELVAGIRYDRFRVGATNNRTREEFASHDGLVSPRVGLVYKPRESVSLYSSYTIAYQPRAGEQLTSLSLSNRTLAPETFRNTEIGAKWDVRAMSLTAAVYRLDRGNVAIASPDDPAVMLLVDGQRMKGLELGVTGSLTRLWSVIGAYAYQDGRITTTQSATIRAGASLGQVPEHTFSLWNRYNLAPRVGAGLGVIRRGEMFVAADNAVVLPAFTRADAALFVTLGRQVRAQVNVENVLNAEYFASAHGNNNITPGSPRAVRVTLSADF